MKISFDIDCTPEEVRRLMGLPDLSDLHATYVDQAKTGLQGGLTSEAVEQLVRSWAPMGETGLALWRQLMDQVGSAKSK